MSVVQQLWTFQSLLTQTLQSMWYLPVMQINIMVHSVSPEWCVPSHSWWNQYFINNLLSDCILFIYTRSKTRDYMLIHRLTNCDLFLFREPPSAVETNLRSRGNLIGHTECQLIILMYDWLSAQSSLVSSLGWIQKCVWGIMRNGLQRDQLQLGMRLISGLILTCLYSAMYLCFRVLHLISFSFIKVFL